MDPKEKPYGEPQTSFYFGTSKMQNATEPAGGTDLKKHCLVNLNTRPYLGYVVLDKSFQNSPLRSKGKESGLAKCLPHKLEDLGSDP